MGKSYFGITFSLYYIAAAVGIGCRIVLKMRYMDAATGFYIRTTLWEMVMNVVLASAIILILGLNRFRRADHDYPIWRHSRAVDIAGILAGIAIIVYTYTDYLPELRNPSDEHLVYRVGTVVVSILGILAAASLISQGVRGRNAAPKGYLAVYASLWQAFGVVTRFNTYTTLTTITDNLFIVLFMLFASLFLLGQARTICGVGRRDGRNYAIPAGLCMSLCGLIAVIPNYIAMLAQGNGMPALMLGYSESVYILLLSIYGVLFVRNISKSIGTV